MPVHVKSATDAARAMDALRRIVHALRAANAGAPVTGAQLYVLRQIGADPRCSMSEIAERTRSAQSSVSEVVARLVEKRLVERNTARDDARRAELTLTPLGQATCSTSGETVQEQLVRGFETLPASDQEQLAGALEHWVARAGLSGVLATFFLEGPPDRPAQP